LAKSLASKVVIGFKWSAFGVFSGRGLQFIGDIILSRILVPEDFGLMAIALAVLAFSEMLTETGFSSALIQKQKNVNSLLNTAWTMEVIKGLCLCALLLLLAKPISGFYNDERLYSLLNTIAILFLFRGCRNVGVIYFRKKLEIHKQVLLDIIPFILQLIFIIPAAFYLHNVWAIVIGIYMRRISELFLSYIMHPYRPSFKINKLALNELFNFGKWIFGISILGAIRKNYTPLFIGKTFDMDTLGYFNRAELFSTLLFTVLVQIIWQVGYPAFSIIQKDITKIKNVYINAIYFISYFGLAIMAVLYVLSEDLIRLFLSEVWLESTGMMKMLLPVGVMSLIGSISPIILQSCGMPHLSTRNSFFSLIILLVLMTLLTYYFGLTGLLTSMIIASSFSLIYGFMLVNRIIDFQLAKVIPLFVYSLINASFIFLSILLTKNILFHKVGFMELVSLLFIGLITFVVLMIVWDKAIKNSMYKVIKGYLA